VTYDPIEQLAAAVDAERRLASVAEALRPDFGGSTPISEDHDALTCTPG
jgi:hypothetical protein